MNINNMGRTEILDWVGEHRESMSDSEFNKFIQENGKQLAARMEQIDRMEKKVYELFAEVSEFDDGVANFFDLGSDKMLGLKIKVLSALKDGKSPEEIGKDYFDILEEFDQESVPDGEVTEVGGWEFDPSKYK